MVAAAIGDEVLWVRLPWLVDDLVDAGSSASTVAPFYKSVATDFNPSVDLTSEEPWSVAFWIYRKGSATAAQYIFGMAGTPRFYGAFALSSNDVLMVGIDGQAISTTATATVGVATHFVLTFNGVNDLKVYKDGTLAQTITTTGGGTLPNANMAIGAQTGGGITTQQQGAIEDFRIFNRVITTAEISLLAASAPSPSGGASFPPIGPGGLVF